MPDPIEKIIENANAPKVAEIDGQRVEQHSIKDQIEAHRYVSAVKAAKKRSLGIRIGKMIPGGSE